MQYKEVKYKIHITGKQNPVEFTNQLRHEDQVAGKISELMMRGLYLPSQKLDGTHTWLPPHRISKVDYTIKTIER